MESLTSLSDALQSAEDRVSSGKRAVAQVWPTGFDPLDEHLAGGLRAGELALVGGPHGLGKTTFVLQILRHVAASGGAAVCFSFELDEMGVLERLLVQEAYSSAGAAAPTVTQVRSLLSSLNPMTPLREALSDVAGMAVAQAALQSYGNRLSVHVSSSRVTTTDVIRQLVLAEVGAGRAPVVVVDYLQKVHVESMLGEDERVTLVVEALKDLALEAAVPVIAVVAATQAGIAPGHRLRVDELRGASALAYEADVILLLNSKRDVVARHHLAYDPRSEERFRQVAVVSIEKNRGGRSDVHVEFRKEFEYCRFDPGGNVLEEQLAETRTPTE